MIRKFIERNYWKFLLFIYCLFNGCKAVLLDGIDFKYRLLIGKKSWSIKEIELLGIVANSEYLDWPLYKYAFGKVKEAIKTNWLFNNLHPKFNEIFGLWNYKNMGNTQDGRVILSIDQTFDGLSTVLVDENKNEWYSRVPYIITSLKPRVPIPKELKIIGSLYKD